MEKITNLGFATSGSDKLFRSLPIITMLITETFKDNNPETNQELKDLYGSYVFVEKQRLISGKTEYVFADSVEAKAKYIENKEMYSEMMFDKFYSLAY